MTSTTDGQPGEREPAASPRGRRRIHAALAVITISVLAVNVLLAVRTMRDRVDAAGVDPMLYAGPTHGDDPLNSPGDAAAQPSDDPRTVAGPDALLGAALAGQGPAGIAMVHPADRPLEAEPAGLPTPPGGRDRQAWVRKLGGVEEQVAAWRVDGHDLAALRKHYDNAARERGFRSLRTTADDQRLIEMQRPSQRGRGRELLTVHLWPGPDHVRVLVKLTRFVDNHDTR